MTSRAEYQRGIMDTYSDPLVHTLVFMKSSQVGATEIILNMIGYHIDVDPCPILCLYPNIEAAESWSKDRLTPMLRDTPAIRGKVHESARRDSDNTIRHKVFPGGHLTVIGANSASGLAMRPIRILLCDEIDRYPASAGGAGKKEGDPISLAKVRTKNFSWSRKIILTGTPTIKGLSRIENAFEKSDKRKFWVPCPHCGEMQTLMWAQVKWSPPYGDGTPESVRYVCLFCEKPWTDAQRWAQVRKGEWRASEKFNGTAGFQLNELYSTFVQLEEPVREFLEVKHLPEQLKVWTNTTLGELWEDHGEEADATTLMMQRENWGPLPPPLILLVTCGVDVQGDRLEVVRVGWGMHEEAWVLEHVVMYGDPSSPTLWEELNDYLLTPTKLQGDRELNVMAACIDTGGHYTDAAHSFCRDKFGRRVWPIKGDDGPRPIWPKKPSKALKGKDRVFIVGVDSVKDLLYGRFKIKIPGPGYFHFQKDFDQEFFGQLTSEIVMTKVSKGFPVREWKLKQNMRNEVLDCVVYAFAALRSMPIRWERVKVRTAAQPMTQAEAVSGGVPDPIPVGPFTVRRPTVQPPQPVRAAGRNNVTKSAFLLRR